ncbi:hypothetical protein F4778DRAFT_754985 [Xylariomycetidae sp. FL2044]|nr:hypothetical protein F4778DRAFT_754985 [Xylariomycetidae sp. FL2044]
MGSDRLWRQEYLFLAQSWRHKARTTLQRHQFIPSLCRRWAPHPQYVVCEQDAARAGQERDTEEPTAHAQVNPDTKASSMTIVQNSPATDLSHYTTADSHSFTQTCTHVRPAGRKSRQSPAPVVARRSHAHQHQYPPLGGCTHLLQLWYVLPGGGEAELPPSTWTSTLWGDVRAWYNCGTSSWGGLAGMRVQGRRAEWNNYA